MISYCNIYHIIFIHILYDRLLNYIFLLYVSQNKFYEQDNKKIIKKIKNIMQKWITKRTADRNQRGWWRAFEG